MDIEPGQPVSLVPVQNPGTPTVSNTKNLASRTLLRNLKFELKVKTIQLRERLNYKILRNTFQNINTIIGLRI